MAGLDLYWPQVRLFVDAQAKSEGLLVSVGVSSKGRTHLITTKLLARQERQMAGLGVPKVKAIFV